MLSAILSLSLFLQVGTSGIPGPTPPTIQVGTIDGSVSRVADNPFWYDYRQLNRSQRRCFPSVWAGEHEGRLPTPCLVEVQLDSLGNIVPHWVKGMGYYHGSALQMYP